MKKYYILEVGNEVNVSNVGVFGDPDRENIEENWNF